MPEPKRVLVTSPTFGACSPAARERLLEAGFEFVEIPRDDGVDREAVEAALPGIVAWIVGYARIDEATFEAAPHLKIVAKHGTGVDNVDLEAAAEHGVVVANAPGANANAVAELVVLHALNYGRDLVGADRTVRAGGWSSELGTELSGKTVGVVGLGQIGQRVVRLTDPFGVDHLAYDVDDRPAFEAEFGVERVGLDELLERADYVTVHVPLTEATRHLIGADELARMKPEACLINTARGGIVDEDALVDAIEAGELGGAALDVLEEEPPSAARSGRLLAADRITVSPHIGGRTEEAMGAISDVTAQNVLNVFEGREPVHRVV